MKILYIIGLVLTVAFGILIFYYAEECSSAKWDAIFADIYGYGYSNYGRASDITMEGGLINMIFLVFYAFLFSFSLKKLKTMTAKVMSIIGVALTGIFLLWDILMVSDPGGLSYDETALGFLGYAVVMLAFCIVNLVQSVRTEKMSLNESDPLNAAME